MSESSPEFLARYEAAKANFERPWANFVASRLRSLQCECQTMVNEGDMEDGDAQRLVSKRSEEYQEMDFETRVSKYANNFHCWWPGGMYRGGDSVYELGLDEEGRKRRDELVRLVDTGIAACGFQDVAKTIGNRGQISKELKAVALLEVLRHVAGDDNELFEYLRS
jgi:hypothetical protein